MPTDEIANHFTALEWIVVAFYMALTTWIGHRLAGKAATVKDFFLGGRTMPWWAVSGSMIATEISALTSIGVPVSRQRTGATLRRTHFSNSTIHQAARPTQKT